MDVAQWTRRSAARIRTDRVAGARESARPVYPTASDDGTYEPTMEFETEVGVERDEQLAALGV